MTAYPFVEALHTLDVVLRAAAVLAPGDKITVELPDCEAGERFELWLRCNPPEELLYRVNNWGRDVDVDTDNPKREIYLHGVTVRWPVVRVMTPDGPAPRRPLSPEMAQRRVPRFSEGDRGVLTTWPPYPPSGPEFSRQ